MEQLVQATFAAVHLLDPSGNTSKDCTFFLHDAAAGALVGQGPSRRILTRPRPEAAWGALDTNVQTSEGGVLYLPIGEGLLQVPMPPDPQDLERLLLIAGGAAGVLERMRLRGQLVRSEALLQNLASLCEEGVVIAAAGGELKLVNRRMEQLCGWSAEEIRERGWFECLYPDPEDRARAVVSVRAAFHGAPADGVDWRITHRDGYPVEVILKSRAITPEGQSAGIIGVFREVRPPAATPATRFEELGRLAATVAHDFNNLAASVAGHAELLARRYPGEVAERAEIILQTVERAATLTGQLEAFSKEQAPWPVATDLGSLCAEVAAQSCSRRTRLTVEPNAPPADVDPKLFRQLLTQLLQNAAESAGAGGEIGIELSRAELPVAPLQRWDTENRSGWVRLRVWDSGPGFPAARSLQLFEPFYTTKAHHHGLGLALVARIASTHKAVIDLPNLPGKGGVFDLYLPIAERPAVGPEMQENPDAGGNERLWVVDDDPAVREYLVAALEAFGYSVVGFESALSVLGAVQRGEAYELLVTDLSMPEMDGVELHLALRAQGIRLPVLFCSGYSERAVSVPTGIDVDFLQKPVAMRTLAQRVRRLLNYSLPQS
jgi:PAS domain S-box-containing protein